MRSCGKTTIRAPSRGWVMVGGLWGGGREGKTTQPSLETRAGRVIYLYYVHFTAPIILCTLRILYLSIYHIMLLYRRHRRRRRRRPGRVPIILRARRTRKTFRVTRLPFDKKNKK